MFVRPQVALLLIAAFVPSVRALDKEWPVERAPARLVVPYTLDREAIKKLPAELLADYPAVYVHAATSYRLEADGTVEGTTHEVIRLNNRRGIDQLGEHRNIVFTPAHEKLSINEARVVKADGRTIAVDGKHAQLRDVPTDYFVYDSSKELIVSFPSLEVGDLIEVIWTTRGKNPEYAGQFFSRYSFGDEKYPVWSDTFAVQVAKGKTLKHAIFNPDKLADGRLPATQTEENGVRTYTWRTVDRRPVAKEEHLPPKDELRPGIAISTFASWDEVAAWERQIRVGCTDCTPELKEIAQRIKKEHKTPTAIARELTYWYKNNVRYISHGDKHDFTPHTPAFVWKNRYGDCKDGVQLLAVMLKEAGIPAGLVSLSPSGDGQIDQAVPSPWSTHTIVHVPIEGKDHWIDTTATYTGWDYLPASDRDRVAYIVDDKGLRFTRTPKLAPEENRTETTTRLTIEANGTSRNVRTVEYHGEAAAVKREEWSDISTNERRRSIRSDLLGAHSKVTFGNPFEVDDKTLRIPHDPVRANFTFDLPKHFHGKEEMDGTISDDTIWSALLGISVDPERESPIELRHVFESKHRYEIAAPKGFLLELPPDDEEVRSKWGVYTLKVNTDKKGRNWTLDLHTRLEKTRVEKADFVEFKKFQDAVSAASHVDIFLKALKDD